MTRKQIMDILNKTAPKILTLKPKYLKIENEYLVLSDEGKILKNFEMHKSDVYKGYKLFKEKEIVNWLVEK